MGKLSPIIESYLKQSPLLPNLADVSIPELREQFNARQKKLNANIPVDGLEVQDSSASNSLIRIYRNPSQDLQPVLIFFHGGGFVFGNLDTLENHCREIALSANCIVISVDYPLAPENPFPTALETLYNSTKYIFQNINNWRGDPTRIFIGGSSSGATLAAALAIMIRDRGGTKLQGQILLCPLTNDDYNTESYLANASGYNLTREQCIWFLSQYLPEKTQRENPYALPLKCKNFQGLPPAMIVTAEFDPLCDDGKAYGKKLQEAKIECKYLCFPGMIHGFSTLPLELPEKAEVLEALRIFIS